MSACKCVAHRWFAVVWASPALDRRRLIPLVVIVLEKFICCHAGMSCIVPVLCAIGCVPAPPPDYQSYDKTTNCRAQQLLFVFLFSGFRPGFFFNLTLVSHWSDFQGRFLLLLRRVFNTLTEMSFTVDADLNNPNSVILTVHLNVVKALM